MRILASTLTLLFVCTLLSCAADGFTTIFDGKDLSKIETTGNWKIQKDGSLYLEPRPGEKGWTRYGSYLWLKDDYKDFVFDLSISTEKEAIQVSILGFTMRLTQLFTASRFRFLIASARRSLVSMTLEE